MRQLTWLEPGTRLDAGLIDAAEARLGVRFPADYRQMVAAHSGASNPDEAEFDLKYEGRPRVGNFGALLGLDETADTVFDALRDLSDQLPSDVVPVVDTGSGDYVCLDYRHDVVPTVVYFAHGQVGERSLIPLASNFAAFVDMLRVPPDD